VSAYTLIVLWLVMSFIIIANGAHAYNEKSYMPAFGGGKEDILLFRLLGAGASWLQGAYFFSCLLLNERTTLSPGS
jgi:hypothetical protein